MSLDVYGLLIRLVKYVLIPVVTVMLFYRKRKKKVSIDQDLLMYFGVAAAGNAALTSAVVAMAINLVRRIVGIELAINRCYLTIGTVLAVIVLPGLLEGAFYFASKYFSLKEKEAVKETLDSIFLLVIAIVCFGTQIGLTTFYFNLPFELYRKIYLITCLAAVFKVALSLAGIVSDIKARREDKNSLENKYNTAKLIKGVFDENKDIVLSIPVALVFYLAFPSEHYLYQQFLAPLIVGCVGIRIRKIFLAAFIPSALVIIVMMFASLDGAIRSMAGAGRNMRSYWGHISPTDFGTAVFMIGCFGWILFEELPDAAFFFPAAFSLFVSIYVTRCNTSVYLTILLMGVLLIRTFVKSVIEKKGKKPWGRRLLDRTLLMVFPVFGIIVVFLVYAYYKELPFSRIADIVLHYRLSYAARMLAMYGLKPFGTFFDMIGWGGSTVANVSSGEEYTFIDSSYPQILIRYGYVTYITATILWGYTTWKALKSGYRRVAFVMALLAVDFVMEHHWYELSYNAFVLIPFADFTGKGEAEATLSALERAKKAFRDKWKEKKYSVIFTVTGLSQLLAAFLILPITFSWLRTIFNGCGLSGGGRNGMIVFAVITVLLLTALIFIWNLSVLVADRFSGKKIRRINAISFAGALVLLMISLMTGNGLIDRITGENADRIERERESLEQIVSYASGKVYADKLPETYIRKIKGISRSYFCGEDFARYENATVIVDAAWDSQCLSGRGFLYLPVSEEDAIFTNDEQMIETLQKEGYHLKGYNSNEYRVDLYALAGMNEVEPLRDGGLRLKGKEHQLIHGPYLELYYGDYTVKYSMKLMGRELAPDDKVCTLRVASYYGKTVNAVVDLYRRDFDGEGCLDYDLPFVGGGQGCEFLLFTEKGVELELSSLSYRRTPDIDTHDRIDSRGRVIRSEFYDLEGNPLEVSGGYYGCEYTYNNQDLIISQRFLGRDLKPVLTDGGFAEIHREFNTKGETVKESYYGVDGEPIEIPGGCHSVEREYDFAGNLISERYYDMSGGPVLINGAYFKYIRTFDEKNQWTSTAYYDTEDNLILQDGNYAIIERSYDDAGNVAEESYYGLQKEPVLCYDSYHKIGRVYDDKKQCIRQMYYGTDGEPALQSGNYAGFTSEYDEAGNVVRLTWLGIDEKPVMTDWGYTCTKRSYDSKKQIIREEFYDLNGEKTILGAGQFAVEHEYDDAGNQISDAYFGLQDEKILVSGVYWKVVRTYDENRRIIHEEYFGTDGQPILVSGKYAMVDFRYDESEKLTKKTFKDMAGNVVEEQTVE